MPLATWKDYLQVRAIDAYAPYLDEALVQRHFEFYGKTLSGTPQIQPRWKRGVDETENAIGDLLGKALRRASTSRRDAKARMDELVENLLAAFGSAIDELDWMSPETQAARRRPSSPSFTVKIGYPEKWRDYPGARRRAVTTWSAT